VRRKRVQMRVYAAPRLVGELAGAFETVQRDVGDLAGRCVLPRRLAQLGGGAGRIQDVVDDLKQKAHFLAELGPERAFAIGESCEGGRARDARAYEPSRRQLV